MQGSTWGVGGGVVKENSNEINSHSKSIGLLPPPPLPGKQNYYSSNYKYGFFQPHRRVCYINTL